MNEIVKDIAYILFVVICAILAKYVIPYIKSKIKCYCDEELIRTIYLAVRYAEQTIVGDKKGKEKLNAVQTYIDKWLKDKGIKISEKELQVLIESAVYMMNNGNTEFNV